MIAVAIAPVTLAFIQSDTEHWRLFCLVALCCAAVRIRVTSEHILAPLFLAASSVTFCAMQLDCY